MPTQDLLIPGPAHNALADALDLPRDCTVRDMIAEIGRLHMAAAEGQHRIRKAERRRTSLRVSEPNICDGGVVTDADPAPNPDPQEPDAA